MQNQNKNRKRNRLRGYDYSQSGWYFVTICIKDKIKCLGKIESKKMEYSQYGDIILKFWQEIPKHYKNVFLDEWIIMPDHIHGIIIIENPIIIANTGNYGLLSKIVKSFKEISLKTIRKNYNDYEFAWQRSFYDHIIRNEKSLNKIREYIRNNPSKWELDKNNLENLSI